MKLVGSQQHALSIAIFSNYLLLDTILFAIPRFLILGLLQQLSTTLCSPPSSPSKQNYISFPAPNSQFLSTTSGAQASEAEETSFLSSISQDWTPQGCVRIVYLAQLTLAAGVIAAALLQFTGALCVREYAKALWRREIHEESCLVVEVERTSLCVDRGLPVIFEEGMEEFEKI
jgi:hypothetical protein